MANPIPDSLPLYEQAEYIAESERLEAEQRRAGDASFVRTYFRDSTANIQIPTDFLTDLNPNLPEIESDEFNFNESRRFSSIYIVINEETKLEELLPVVLTFITRGRFHDYTDLDKARQQLYNHPENLFKPGLQLPEKTPRIVIALEYPESQLDLRPIAQLCGVNGFAFSQFHAGEIGEIIEWPEERARLITMATEFQYGCTSVAQTKFAKDTWIVYGLPQHLLLEDKDLESISGFEAHVAPYIRNKMKEMRRWVLPDLDPISFNEDDLVHSLRCSVLLGKMDSKIKSRREGVDSFIEYFADQFPRFWFRLYHRMLHHDIGEAGSSIGDIPAAHPDQQRLKKLAGVLEYRTMMRAVANRHLMKVPEDFVQHYFYEPDPTKNPQAAYEVAILHFIDRLAGALFVEANTNWDNFIQGPTGSLTYDQVVHFLEAIADRCDIAHDTPLGPSGYLALTYFINQGFSPEQLEEIAHSIGIKITNKGEFNLRCKRLGGALIKLLNIAKEHDLTTEQIVPIFQFTLEELLEASLSNYHRSGPAALVFLYMFAMYVNQKFDGYFFGGVEDE